MVDKNIRRIYNIDMELEILEKEIEEKIEENQIDFDFLTEKENADGQTLTSGESFDWVAEETLVVVLKTQDGLCEFDLCGKKMIDWVKIASCGCEQKVVDEPSENDLLETLKGLAGDFKFVVVLYSDTPLLKKETFLDVVKFFSSKNMNVLKLKRGYVFKTEFLQNAQILMSTNVENFGEEDFALIDSAEKISYAFNVLRARILSYHKQNGVVLLGENTIFVDADVEIEPGVVIYPNNVIKGESYIGKNVIIESGNYIIDTIVCDGAFVCQSYIEKSKVGEGKTVGPFARVINQKI